MASKKRGSLSKREFAAKAKATPKVTTRSTAAKSIAPLSGAGPLQPGQQRVQSNYMDTEGYTQDIYNALPSNSPAKVSAASRAGDAARKVAQRNQAAKAQKAKNSGSSSQSIGSRIMDVAGSAGAALRNVPGLKQIAGYGDDYVNTGNKASLGKVMAPFAIGAAIPAGMFAAGAGAAGGLSSLAGLGRGIIGRGIGSLGRGVRNIGEIGEGAAARMPVSAFPTAGTGAVIASQLIGTEGLDSINDVAPDTGWTQPYGQPEVKGTSVIDGGEQTDDNPNRYRDPTEEDNARNTGRDYEADTDAANADMGDLNQWNVPTQADYTQQQNEQYGGGPGPVDQASPRVTNQMRGSGLFGTGKGVGNPAGDDSYIKELRKAYASNGGEKWLREQFEELIRALDPTYAQYQKEGTDALNQNLWDQNTKLASVMNANNTGDSEQRAQIMAGQQRDTTTALGNLLAKLALNKSQDISGYRSQMAGKLGEYKQTQQTNKQKLMEAIQGYRDKQWDREYKMKELNQKGSGTSDFGTTTYWGNNAKGEPVYRNKKTGKLEVGTGLTKPSNSLTPQLQQDENGNWYYEM